MKSTTLLTCSLLIWAAASCTQKPTRYVNPLLGTETLWDSTELGFKPTRRTWGAETFPGSSLPNAMVQVSPVTTFRSGAGYQYEDSTILGFSHTNKGHWNLNHLPVLPISGEACVDDYGSRYSHETEEAHPAYYKVRLERYRVTAELTSTLRAAFHKYTFDDNADISMLINLPRSNEKVKNWGLHQNGSKSVSGYQETGKNTVYFWIETNQSIIAIDSLTDTSGNLIADSSDAAGASPVSDKYLTPIPRLRFEGTSNILEARIGISFVSEDGAKKNLESEIGSRSFNDIVAEGESVWDTLLGKISLKGGTDKEKKTFYSTFYKSMLWPALRSDVDGRHRDADGNIVKTDYSYYTIPSFWDDYRNKLVLLELIRPDVTADVIKSCMEIAERTGFLPTFFHGDHASTFITGAYLRGIHDFDIRSAYKMMLTNASKDSKARPYVNEYLEKGYVSEYDLHNVQIHTPAKASVTKTLEYSYDDYSISLLAKELGDTANYRTFSERSKNYKNVFDKTTGFMRGRTENGEWISEFDPCFPYYHFMYREATAWMSSFFAPHDTQGLIDLYGGTDRLEMKLDSLFTIPWKGYEAHNLSVFIGQYCHGNQPDHGYPFLYSLLGKPDKTQELVDTILSNFYSMGAHHLAYAGMDDAGEMSSWYVLSSLGIYTYSPAAPEYLVTVPLFRKSILDIGGQRTIIRRHGNSRSLDYFSSNGKRSDGHYISHKDLVDGGLDVYTK